MLIPIYENLDMKFFDNYNLFGLIEENDQESTINFSYMRQTFSQKGEKENFEGFGDKMGLLN